MVVNGPSAPWCSGISSGRSGLVLLFARNRLSHAIGVAPGPAYVLQRAKSAELGTRASQPSSLRHEIIAESESRCRVDNLQLLDTRHQVALRNHPARVQKNRDYLRLGKQPAIADSLDNRYHPLHRLANTSLYQVSDKQLTSARVFSVAVSYALESIRLTIPIFQRQDLRKLANPNEIQTIVCRLLVSQRQCLPCEPSSRKTIRRSGKEISSIRRPFPRRACRQV